MKIFNISYTRPGIAHKNPQPIIRIFHLHVKRYILLDIYFNYASNWLDFLFNRYVLANL